MKELNLTIKRGTTFTRRVRWESRTLAYRPITAVTQTGALQLSVTAHGIPEGWPAALMNAKGGIAELNAEYNPPRDSDFHVASVVDADTVEFNAINGANYKPWTSGGQIVFYLPENLASYGVARCQLRTSFAPDGVLLYEAAPEIDVTNYAVELAFPAADSAAWTFDRAVYDLEVEDADGKVQTLLFGEITVDGEVTIPVVAP